MELGVSECEPGTTNGVPTLSTARHFLLIGALIAGGCQPDASRDRGELGPDGSLDFAEPPATWTSAEPRLSAEELVRASTSHVAALGLPIGVEVTFYASTAGMVVCDTPLCLQLRDPQVIGRRIADGQGQAVVDLYVDADRPIETVFYQALVEDHQRGEAIVTEPLQRQVTVEEAAAAVHFHNATLEAGLTETFTSGNSHTGGIAWVDYNNDFYADLFIANGGGFNHRLYRNEGDGTFTDVSDHIRKPDLLAEGAGVKFADVDNDGFSDILVIVDNAHEMNSWLTQPEHGGANLLYMNMGDGTFEEEGRSRGVSDPDGRRNICGGFADVDLDGAIDLHLGEWAMNTLPMGTLDNFDWTAINGGDGFFSDATTGAGTDGYGRDALTCGWFDANMDGHPDLYVGNVTGDDEAEPGTNESADDVLYLSNGDGTFRDGTADSPGFGDDAWAAMGWDVGDIDNDGDWDLYVADRWDTNAPLPRGNPLYLNNGDGTFEDNSCDDAGICTGYAAWPTSFADFDRDGDVDLYVGTAHPWFPDLLYVNDGEGRFTSHESRELMGNNSRGGAVADYDGDGDVDVFVSTYNGNGHLYENEGTDDGNWLEVRLFGTQSSTDAIGATVYATVGGQTQMRRVSGGDSSHSQSEQIVHFGVGDAEQVDIRVEWPSGLAQEFSTVTVGDLVFVDETAGLLLETPMFLATWDAVARELTVLASSNFGGRTGFEVIGFGPLEYEARRVRFHAVFGEAGNPPAYVEIESARGQIYQVVVD